MDDFARLGRMVWRGDAVPLLGGDQAVVPFVLRDRKQFQPRLLLSDGSVSVFSSHSTLDVAKAQALHEAEKWALLRAEELRTINPQVCDEPKIVYQGVDLVVEDIPAPTTIRSWVFQGPVTQNYWTEISITNSHTNTGETSLRYLVGPYSNLDRAKDAAIAGAIAGASVNQLSAEDEDADTPYDHQVTLVIQLALERRVRASDWCFPLGEEPEDQIAARISLVQIDQTNRAVLMHSGSLSSADNPVGSHQLPLRGAGEAAPIRHLSQPALAPHTPCASSDWK